MLLLGRLVRLGREIAPTDLKIKLFLSKNHGKNDQFYH